MKIFKYYCCSPIKTKKSMLNYNILDNDQQNVKEEDRPIFNYSVPAPTPSTITEEISISPFIPLKRATYPSPTPSVAPLPYHTTMPS